MWKSDIIRYLLMPLDWLAVTLSLCLIRCRRQFQDTQNCCPALSVHLVFDHWFRIHTFQRSRMSRLQDSKKLPVALCHTFQSIVSEINSNSSCSVFKHLGSHCIYLSRFEFSPREQFSTLWQLRVRKLWWCIHWVEMRGLKVKWWPPSLWNS